MATKVTCDQCGKEIKDAVKEGCLYSIYVQLPDNEEGEFCNEDCLYIWLTGRLQDKKAINQLEEQA